MEASHATRWGDLPPEMMDLILCNLSWEQLAPISSVCRAFRAAYRKQLAVEQKARCDLAAAIFGLKRISCVAGIIERFFKGEPVPLEWCTGFGPFPQCRIFKDGTVRGPTPGDDRFMVRAGDASVAATVLAKPKSVDGAARGALLMSVITPCSSQFCLQICRKRHGAVICVKPRGDEDLAGVAFIQALMSLKPAPLFGDVGPHAHIRIMRKVSDGQVTQAGLRRQIAPLLPFASQYIGSSAVAGLPGFVEERFKVGQAGISQTPSLRCKGDNPWITVDW
jgi:hypothetical protein